MWCTPSRTKPRKDDAGASSTEAVSASGVGPGAGKAAGAGVSTKSADEAEAAIAVAGSGGSLKRCQPLPGLSTASCGAGTSAAPSTRDTRAMPRCVGSVFANSSYSTLSCCTGAAQCHCVRSTA